MSGPVAAQAGTRFQRFMNHPAGTLTVPLLYSCSFSVKYTMAQQNILLSSLCLAIFHATATRNRRPTRTASQSPTGPRTVFFWAPLMKWCLVAAGVKDLSRPAEKLSVSQNVGQ